MNEQFKKKFKTPDMSYRSIPFWAWNAKMDQEEIAIQICNMKEAGFGGFFMHSREGLETEYMGKEWEECIKRAVDEAKKLGMKAWLYDEDRWPSGTAGGKVPANGDACRCKGLTLEVCNEKDTSRIIRDWNYQEDEAIDGECGVIALYAAIIRDTKILAFRRLEKKVQKLQDKEKLLIIRLEVSASREWFNYEAPPDNLNPDCVDAFILKTHEKYKNMVGNSFGRTVPGIFTDEPSLNDRRAFFGKNKAWIPWTYDNASYFINKKGYDFFEYLPEFYFDGVFSKKIRHDYWHVITLRFSETYFERISKWCEANKLYFTGHFLQEDKMGMGTRVNGAIMPHYRYMHIPGIDMLGEQNLEYITVKQCTSVANQLGKPYVLTETYAGTGWDFTLEGQKWSGDWQYVLGVSRRCQHLALYTLRGCRKRDYPPSFNYNAVWWKYSHVVEDYFARLGVALEEGKPIRKILLLHPCSTVWTRLGVNPYGNPYRGKERDVPKLNEYGDEYNDLIRFLVEQHFDCDLGDEIIIQEYATVENKTFKIGEASYDVVVIPEVDTLFKSTYEILTKFMSNGGKVIILGKLPNLTDGDEKEDEVRRCFIKQDGLVLLERKEEIIQELEEFRKISICNKDGLQQPQILYQLREVCGGAILFLVNVDRDYSHYVKIETDYIGQCEELNLLSGETKQATGVYYMNHKTVIETVFEATDSKLYYFDTTRECNVFVEEVQAEVETEYLPQQCSIQLSGPNVLTLDQCRYRLCEDTLSEKMELWKAQMHIREALGMRQINVNGIEQRYKWINTSHPMDGKELELNFEFYTEKEIKNCSLVIERPEDFELLLNGIKIDKKDSGWYLDKAFRVIKLPGLEAGRNEIVMRCFYKNNMELENIYILGEFSVTRERRLSEPVLQLSIGDWCEQGLFHYCGTVRYQYCYRYRESLKTELLLDPMAVCMSVFINGKEIKVPWQLRKPVDITSLLHDGVNQIDIELVGSSRNMLGPFHYKKDRPLIMNAECFCPNEEDYQEGYGLVPYGLKSRPLIRTYKLV